MNAIYYHEDNCFMDYDISNLLRKNNFFVQNTTDMGNLISTIIISKAKLVIIKSSNKYIHEIIEDKYLQSTIFNGVSFIVFDADKSGDLVYKRAFYQELEVLINSILNRSIDSYKIFNLDQHLITLGMRPKFRGYILLRDCIKYSVFLNQYKTCPMSKIYEKVAEKHNTTPKNVERLVRLMIIGSLKKADTKELSRRTGIHEEFFKTPPTTNCFIELICEYLNLYI